MAVFLSDRFLYYLFIEMRFKNRIFAKKDFLRAKFLQQKKFEMVP